MWPMFRHAASRSSLRTRHTDWKTLVPNGTIQPPGIAGGYEAKSANHLTASAAERRKGWESKHIHTHMWLSGCLHHRTTVDW